MKSFSQFSVKCYSVVRLAHSEVTVSKNGKVKKMLFVITIWVLCIRKGGP